MTIMMYVIGLAMVIILLGFIGMIGFVNSKMKEVDDLRNSLAEWQKYVSNLVGEKIPE